VDREQLAHFLRLRRAALQPEDVGLVRGARRRTDGLRREEIALLCDMSVDYYTRLEQGRGPRPSEQMLAAIARGFRLTLDERDHLFRLAGHHAPARALRSEHIAPGLMRVLDRLQDTPAQIITELGETLVQTRPARALFGDETKYTGLARCVGHRWFTEPAAREIYPVDDHPTVSRNFVAAARMVHAKHGPGSRAADLVDDLLQRSTEFAELWETHVVLSNRSGYTKRIQHPELGIVTVQCQQLLDPEQSQSLLVPTATPGTDDHDKLQLLGMLPDRVLSITSVQ
jgi:transcriptional regulator with XRE-family HTH domain